MSTKELVIELRIPLSGDMFEDAAATTKAGEITNAMTESLVQEFGEGGFILRARRAGGSGQANGVREPGIASVTEVSLS